ncbi:AAA family ATPase [Siminovitchia sediminis]|uniref:AAA family ATPase n=1 Tax=Siminovitchia sediminis TaxID=1274353 RepID=A0ABW4KM59_9BACI
MKLKQIHLYGYGKLHNIVFDNLSDLQVFYGENEAGKSTVMSFVHSILFGFPAQQQSELRYEPKTHSAYGGKLVFQTERFGEVIIERVKGRASGDVTILLGNGPVDESEFLPKFLNGADKTMFRRIFSFDLDGLQEIHRLKEEDIGKYLVAAGTIGTDDLLKIEKELQKDLHQLFKPGGRKPVLNDHLKQLRNQEQQLKKAKQQYVLYESLLSEAQEVTSRVDQSKSRLEEINDRLDHLKELLNKWPLITEKEQLDNRYSKVKSIEFPADGLRRLETYEERLTELSGRLRTAEQRVEAAERKMEANAPLQGFDPVVAEKHLHEWPVHLQKMDDLSTITRSIEDRQKEAESVRKELQYPIGKAHSIQEVSLGMDQKAKLKEAVRQLTRQEFRLNNLEEQLVHELETLHSIEQACNDIEKRFVHERLFKDWERQLERQRSTDQLVEERKQLLEEVEVLRGRKRQEQVKQKNEQRKTTLISSGIVVLSACLLGWSVLSGQWGGGLLALLVMAYSVIQILQRKETSGLVFITETLHEKESQLKSTEEQLESTSSVEPAIAYKYKEQLQLREQWKEQFTRLEEQRHRVEESQSDIQSVKEKIRVLGDHLNEIKISLGLNIDFSHMKMEDAFSMLKRLQELDRQLQEKMAKRDQIQKELDQWTTALYHFLKKFRQVYSVHTPEECIFFLRETVKKEQEKRAALQEQEENVSYLKVEIQRLQNEMSIMQFKVQQLFESAQVSNEEEFRQKAKLFEEKVLLKERLELLRHQLGMEENHGYQSKEELQNDIRRLEEESHKRTRLLDEDRNRMAAINQEIRFLEEGGTYTEKLHLFRHNRFLFNEKARKWAELAVADHLLKKIMKKYKEGRFPKVIRKATEYFSFLTDEEYIRIHVKTDGTLEVERKDRILFAPHELSRGTGEQLYISIRLGLVDVLKEEFPFPIIIDDGFVNFDHKRTKKVLQLIEEISSDIQVLLFTCHRHMAQQFSNEQIIQIHEKKTSPV